MFIKYTTRHFMLFLLVSEVVTKYAKYLTISFQDSGKNFCEENVKKIVEMWESISLESYWNF